MSVEAEKPYPGANATPQQLLALADQYRRCTDALLDAGLSRKSERLPPSRVLAIHAVELYLNAILRSAGHSPGDLRRLQHDLAARVSLASDAKLVLRKGTSTHLKRLTDNREYLVARYEPNAAGLSELNRMKATLEEIARKAAKLVTPEAV